jgi:hypothetical protein
MAYIDENGAANIEKLSQKTAKLSGTCIKTGTKSLLTFLLT